MSENPRGTARRPGERRRWLDDPRHVKALVYGLYTVCLALLAGELVIDRHADFGYQAWFGFYALFGFLVYIGIVNAGKLLRRLLRRSEDYYLPTDDRGGNRRDG